MGQVYVAGLLPDSVIERIRQTGRELDFDTPKLLHITFLAPVLDRELLSLQQAVARVANNHWAFLVELKGLQVISHPGDHQDHYILRAWPVEDLTKIHNELLQACGRRSFDRAYLPHVTVAQGPLDSTTETLLLQQAGALQFEFPLSGLAIIGRDPGRPYRVWDQLAFKGGETG